MNGDSITAVPISAGRTYTIDDIRRVASDKAPVTVASDTTQLVRTGFEAVLANALTQETYGLTTGVADLSSNRPTVSLDKAQRNLLLSHAVGTGEVLPSNVVRAAIFCRLVCFSKGLSGVSPEIVQFLADVLNKDVTPIVPSLGSIGAADLTVMAGIFVTLCNKGQVVYKGEILAPYAAYKKAGINYPKKLQTREGLALICGNEGALALTSLLLSDLAAYAHKSTLATALCFEGRTGTSSVYASATQTLKPFPPQIKAAQQLQTALDGSTQIAASYKNEAAAFLQDPPSFKTAATVLGNVQDAANRANEIVAIEINGVTDNPVFSDGQPLSSGGYLCTQLAAVLDQQVLAIATAAQSSVARIQILLNDEYNEGLPGYLIPDTTNNSGFMICAYTAQSVLSEIKALAYPRSSFSATVANGWEDVSSNAMNAALNVTRVLALANEILAIECALALQAMALRTQQNRTVRFGKETSKIYARTAKLCNKRRIPFPVMDDYYINDFVTLVRKNLSDLL